MIKEFVERFNTNTPQLRDVFQSAHPQSYLDIVKAVIVALEDVDAYENPDPNNVHEINDGSYQGTLVYVIPQTGYQPYTYWYVKVEYGSCSGCDTLEAIHGYSDKPPTEEQVTDYMTLALHIVQGLKRMGDEEFDE